MNEFYERRIKEELFNIDCVEKELSAQLQQNPKINKKYIDDMQTRIVTSKKAIFIYESRIAGA